ncbi:YopX family protein [uncultured Robinsoniella sp.]|uniref:YopX family protein n=1 Tax=uncultured Robinsoniella sp. TaxID=904190 RepID=UPI00290BCDAB|nr:YopX family protein [Clostridiales bacterium]
MRKIIFRGKQIGTGTWIHGYLFRIWERAYILWGTCNDIPCKIEVEPETVCQCTGLRDKNGREIYEADIFVMDDPEIKHTVEWNDTGFMGKQQGTYGSYVGLSHWKDKIVVIGNIHDN